MQPMISHGTNTQASPDRVPLQEAQEATEVEERVQGPMEGSGAGLSIDDYYTKQELSTMMGFEDKGFDGMGKEADNLLKWAKLSEGDPLDIIHSLIKGLGVTYKGKELMRRLNQWVTFDTQQKDLEKRKSRIV